MTREEAAQTINDLIIVMNECDEGYYISSNQIKALNMAIEALEQIEAIEDIINVSNLTIQEDVLKYKMIVDVVKGEW